MICKYSLFVLTVFGLSLAVHAQEKDTPAPVQIRAVLHDPVHPTADLFYTDKTGAVTRLNFRPQDLTEALSMQPVNGSLVLYDKAAIYPKNPAASLAASVILPPEIKRALVIVLPAPAGEHRLPVHPGKITNVPPVTKRDEFNMAQTNFYYKQGEAWVPFTERQLQFLDAYRRIFIIHATPGALQPTVTTIVDTNQKLARP